MSSDEGNNVLLCVFDICCQIAVEECGLCPWNTVIRNFTQIGHCLNPDIHRQEIKVEHCLHSIADMAVAQSAFHAAAFLSQLHRM